MNPLWSLVILLTSVLGGTTSLVIEPTPERSLEETVIDQKQKMSQLAERMSLMENLIQRVENRLSAAIQDAEKRCLEETNRHLGKTEELEKDWSNKQNDTSVKLQDLERRTVEQRVEILKSVSEVKKICDESMAEVEGKLLRAENRFTKVDTHLLMEVLQLKTVSSEAIEKVRNVENKISSDLERDRLKLDMLEVNINETRAMVSSLEKPQHSSNDAIQSNISSWIEETRLQINDSIKVGLQNLRSNFTGKMRFFETSLSKLENDCANACHVAKLNEETQKLATTLRNEFQGFQSEFSLRVKHLEERSVSRDDMPAIRTTLENQSSQISVLNERLFNVENSCPYPPSIAHGYPLIGNRSHGAVVSYACLGDSTPVGASEIKCLHGEWTGVLPQCMSGCNLKDLRHPHGLVIRNLTIEHSKTLDNLRCEQGYVLASPSGSITCFNGTWRVSRYPCIEEHNQCGLVANHVGNSGRVVGRNGSDPLWPWMAAVYSRAKNSHPPQYGFRCGGSVIHRHFILTSARCMHYSEKPVFETNQVKIKLGLTDLRNETHLQEFEVRKIHVHPRYRFGVSLDYGIALVELEKPVEFNSFVKPVCLPPKEIYEDSQLYKPHSVGLTIGWGDSGKTDKPSSKPVVLTDRLKEIENIIQTRDVCVESLKDETSKAFFTDRMFCVSEGNVSTCRGDAGNPAMQSLVNEEGRVIWTQVGILSFLSACGMPGNYVFCVHLQKLMPWIDDIIESAALR